MQLTPLEKNIITISYKKRLSHISSCLTAVALIDRIYKIKKESDVFILSSGHCALALYCVLQKVYGINAEELFERHGIHPNRNLNDKIYCSTGSLGQGVTVAVGMALADRNKNIYVLISDGELAEGSCWESLQIAKEQNLTNLVIFVNANGSSAFKYLDIDIMKKRLSLFFPVTLVRTQLTKFPKWLQGYDGHYVILDETKYKELL